MKLFYRMSRFICWLLFKIFYRHKVYGAEHIPQGKAILAPNHVSFYDPPLVGISCSEEVHYLARYTLFEKRILGPIIRGLNAFPVSGNSGDLKTIKSIVGLLQQEEKVMIFPEGIRTYDGRLAEIKSGIALIALRANAPIVPAYIKGTYEIWPRQKRFPKLWGRTICLFGAPIYPEKYSHLQRKEAQGLLTDELKNAIKELEIEAFKL